MARRSPSGRFPALRQGRRRESLWLFSAWSTSTILSNGVVLITSLNAAALALLPFTIVRSRGVLHLRTDQIANTEAQAVTYGKIVVTQEASTAGVASVPTPISEGNSDFHVYEQVATAYILSSAVGIDAAAGVMHVFDSKAMRKVDSGEDLIAVAEVPATGLSEGVIFRTQTRTLIKLH